MPVSSPCSPDGELHSASVLRRGAMYFLWRLRICIDNIPPELILYFKLADKAGYVYSFSANSALKKRWFTRPFAESVEFE